MNEHTEDIQREESENREYMIFAYKRIGLGIAAAILLLWGLWTGLGLIRSDDVTEAFLPAKTEPKAVVKLHEPDSHAVAVEKDFYKKAESSPVSESHGAVEERMPHTASRPAPFHSTEDTGSVIGHGGSVVKKLATHVKGEAFVLAVIKPLNHELNERFWGWRQNDILDFTDNVNNFQLGVLEVTRRTSVSLAERLSRTGSTASFDIHLERAMNWFMVKADQYWFPSPETKYNDGLDEFRAYLEKLRKGEASFYTRPDNLIPLLAAYEDLLGSCDENLVKAKEEDGSPVSFFSADDYFYYAQGVASTMLTILEAIMMDFQVTLESRHGTEVIHHAIESCRRAVEIQPWIIMEGDLDSIFSNHRANIAAPISHARFYISVLIKTLST